MEPEDKKYKQKILRKSLKTKIQIHADNPVLASSCLIRLFLSEVECSVTILVS